MCHRTAFCISQRKKDDFSSHEWKFCFNKLLMRNSRWVIWIYFIQMNGFVNPESLLQCTLYQSRTCILLSHPQVKFTDFCNLGNNLNHTPSDRSLKCGRYLFRYHTRRKNHSLLTENRSYWKKRQLLFVPRNERRVRSLVSARIQSFSGVQSLHRLFTQAGVRGVWWG